MPYGFVGVAWHMASGEVARDTGPGRVDAVTLDEAALIEPLPLERVARLEAKPVEPVSLDDPDGADPVVVGAKAAALARALASGLPVLAGFVLTTEWAAGPRTYE